MARSRTGERWPKSVGTKPATCAAMSWSYVCLQSSYLHLNLTRMATTPRLWAGLRLRLGPVLAARLGADRLAVIVEDPDPSRAGARVHRAVRQSSYACGVATRAWNSPPMTRRLRTSQEVALVSLDMARQARLEVGARHGVVPLWSTMRACVGASAEPWLDATALARAVGIARLELGAWALSEGGTLPETPVPAPAPLHHNAGLGALTVTRAVCAAYRVQPLQLMAREPTRRTLAAVATALGLEPGALSVRVGATPAAVAGLMARTMEGGVEAPASAMRAVRICLADPRLLLAVPAYRVPHPPGPRPQPTREQTLALRSV